MFLMIMKNGFLARVILKVIKSFTNIVGNSLSHYPAWQDVTQYPDQSAALIVQDGAILLDGFWGYCKDVVGETPADTLCVFISDHVRAVRERFVPVDLENQDLRLRRASMKEDVTKQIAKHQDDWACHCSLAYLVTPDGARRLLEYASKFGFTRAADRYLRDVMVSHGKNYCSVRCLATSSSDLFKSDVWSR